jgi:prepilin-type N-terminal cleavage/methylation domain-containing protein/prepilin-type processing-associated H-X9-DG protein
MQRRAFTLIELLVVMSAVSLLTAILIPALGAARQQGRDVACLSNLRQMVIAADMYVGSNDGYYPLTQDVSREYEGRAYEYVWDFVTVVDKKTGEKTLEPGILWQGCGITAVQQCPSFKGADNWGGQAFTGYNYNASYIGGSRRKDLWLGRESHTPSAKACQIKRPGRCAIFGDGQYANGANKMMRAPFAGNLDQDFAAAGRYAGTQGYRHRGMTNTAFCDGSAARVIERFTQTDKYAQERIAEGTGFLSADNSAYDLD